MLVDLLKPKQLGDKVTIQFIRNEEQHQGDYYTTGNSKRPRT